MACLANSETMLWSWQASRETAQDKMLSAMFSSTPEPSRFPLLSRRETTSLVCKHLASRGAVMSHRSVLTHEAQASALPAQRSSKDV